MDLFHDIDPIVQDHKKVSPNFFTLCDLAQENMLGARSSLSDDEEEIWEGEGEREGFNFFQDFVDDE